MTRKKTWIISGGAVAVLGVGLTTSYLFSANWPVDRFEFLEGRTPRLRVVMVRDLMEEVRYYSWEADFKTFKVKVARELEAMGFTVSKSPSDGHFLLWKNRRGVEVEMFAGRTVVRQDLRTSTVDPGWVTVGVAGPLPDNWVSHFRYGLEPYPSASD